MKREHIKVVAICAKPGNEKAETLGGAMRRWFDERCLPCFFLTHAHDTADFLAKAEGVDLVLVLGGDGTFVSVARRLAANPTPLLGVNLGRVGFLAEITPDSWEDSLRRLTTHGVFIEKGIALAYSLERGGRVILDGLAVNDLVVSRGGPARLVSLSLAVNERRLVATRADGFIVSTPTGSTGYTGSAGGPLLHPGLDAYVLTPICPFMSSFPPLVVAGDTRFSLTVEETGPEIYLTVDGQESLQLREGDTLNVTGKADGVRFARLDGEGYFEKLRLAGFVRDFTS